MQDLAVRGGTLGPRTVHRSLCEPADENQCLIDLRRAGWVEPAGLVYTATLTEAEIRRGRRVVVWGPTEQRVANYVSRMRLPQVLEEIGATHDISPVDEYDTGSRLLEVFRFDGEVGAERLGEMVLNQVDRYSPFAADALYKSICEVGANVPQHSGEDHGFVAAQVMRRTPSPKVLFAVGDSGVGLVETLRPLLEFEDESAVIDRVLEEGMSRLPGAGHGNGIVGTRQVLADAGGSLTVATGSTMRQAEGVAVHGRSFDRQIEGTLLQGSALIG